MLLGKLAELEWYLRMILWNCTHFYFLCLLVLLWLHRREKKKWKLIVAQSCLTLCDPVKCSLSGSSVHGILQSRIPEWVAIPFSKVSSWTRGQTQVSWIASRFFTIWASKEAQHRRRSLFIGNIHSNIEYDGQHIDNFSEMHCGKETPLYCIYSVFFSWNLQIVSK